MGKKLALVMFGQAVFYVLLLVFGFPVFGWSTDSVAFFGTLIVGLVLFAYGVFDMSFPGGSAPANLGGPQYVIGSYFVVSGLLFFTVKVVLTYVFGFVF